MKPAVDAASEKLIYLHGFNSASVDNEGNLIATKSKLQLLSQFCKQHNYIFVAPNLDYRDPLGVVEQLTDLAEELNVHASFSDTTFIGTSLGGFMAEIMAMKTLTSAIMINPAINPSQSLMRSIGKCQNYVTGEEYRWTQENCDAFKVLERESTGYCCDGIPRTVLLDVGDEILDARKTIKKYEDKVALHVFEGGSHRFDHMEEAMPAISDALMYCAVC